MPKLSVLSFSLGALLTVAACSSSDSGGPPVLNTAPLLQLLGNPFVVEATTQDVALMATDANPGDLLNFSVEPTLSYATLTDHGDGTATYELAPMVGDSGVQSVTLTVSDNATPPLSHSQTVELTVPFAGSSLVTGTVKDATSMLPVADVLVTLQATPFNAISAADGSFGLYLLGGANQVVAAGKHGYYNGSTPANASSSGMEILISEVPIGSNPSYSFVESTQCGVCHPDQEANWNGSAMAKAGLNTWVHDVYAGNGTPGGMGGFVYTRDSVFAGTNPDSECASCHQPELWVGAGFAGRMESPLDVGYPSNAVLHGISCETCHKIASVDESKIDFPGLFPGAVVLNLPASGQVQYGAYPDSDFNTPGIMQPAYQPQLLAEVCGVCHQDKNDPDENHTYTGVTSEPTYTEWVESAYADPNSSSFATCVDCHMPSNGQTRACINVFFDREPGTIRSHAIEGTTPGFLENAVELSMQTQVNAGQLEVSVAVNNSLTGHHVPTGVTIRNMILVVEAWEDGNDPLTSPLNHSGSQVIHDLGGIGNPAQGYYAGLPGKFFAKVNHDANMQGPTFFTDATGIQFDSRIPALTTDSTSYTFDMPASGSGIVHVRARLIYRRSFRFLLDAKGWTTDGHGNPLGDIAAPNYGHLMEQATEDVAF